MIMQRIMDELRGEVALLSRKSQKLVEGAIETLELSETSIHSDLARLDRELKLLEGKIETMCISCLMKEPYAVDFRYIFGVVKTLPELSSIRSQVRTIIKWANLYSAPFSPDIKVIAAKTKEICDFAVTALIDEDPSQSERVIRLESEIDEIEERIVETTNSLSEAFLAKAFERIADLARNISEEVVYFVQAKDIRHTGGDANARMDGQRKTV